MKRILLFGVAAVAAIAVVVTAPTARAATATSTLTVSATVAASCTIDPATLTFGTAYNGTAAVSDSTTVTIHCTTGANAWLSFGLGSNASGVQRQMSGGLGEFLAYNLYADAGHTVAYDTVATDPGNTYHVIGGPADSTITIYGQIPTGQYVSSGAYSDSVVSTVHF